MEFEFDEKKGQLNSKKHGFDFVEAQKLWNDPDRLEVPARAEDESRYLLVGKIENKRWSAIFTRRADKIRIISARRSREKEVKLHESKGL